MHAASSACRQKPGTTCPARPSGTSLARATALASDRRCSTGPLPGRIETSEAGSGVRIEGDRPLEKLVFWCIRRTLCPEPYVALRVEPGKQEQWSLRYTFYELDARKGAE